MQNLVMRERYMSFFTKSTRQKGESWKTYDEVQKIEHDGRFSGPRTKRVHSVSDQKQYAADPPPLIWVAGHHLKQV